jgi:hypothetical protein
MSVAMSVHVLEELTLVTPLGVKFRDESTATPVAGDLVVTLHPDGAADRKTRGVINRSGIFVFRNLPGMRDIEHGAGNGAFWAAQSPQFDFVLEVTDRAARFLPYSLALQLPGRRLLTLPAVSPFEPTDALPLFSAPSRDAVEAMAVIRMELVDAVSHEPAAWALVEARTETTTIRGLADERGRVMLALPWPPPHVVLGSLPSADPAWSVDLTIRYARRAPVPTRPDLEDVLTQPIAFTTTATLHFGQELQLAPISITPAGSPP